MKTFNAKLPCALVLMALTTAATFSNAIANDEQYLQSDPIDINGYVKEAPVTDHELETVNNELRKQSTAIKVNKQKAKKYGQLSRSTEKLADATEEMIEERKESQVTIDKFNKKIDCMMAEGLKDGCEEYQKQPIQDEVRVAQAAPVVQTQVEAPASSENFGEAIKILPYAGLTTIMTENENLEAGVAAGVRVETNINKRFSIGMGFKYTTMKTTDRSNNSMSSGYYDYYSSFYNNGREIEYSNLNFDIYSKFFVINHDRFRPYIGAGLGYNRSTMNYTDNNSANTYQGQYYNFGDEEVNTSHVNAELLVGSEILFSNTIGMNLELAYNKAIGSNLSSENGIDQYQAPDQQRLNDLSASVTDADIVSLNASLLIQF